jgi:Polyketide cyclase / dehydrase and lipid transport
MAGRFEATVVVDRPIEEAFAFLADGENDPKFSARVLEIAKTTGGPPGVGTVYASTVKDAGVKSRREFKLTEFEAPTRIRWTELSKNLVTAAEGGYDLAPEGAGTRVNLHNVLEGHGFGKLIAPLALRSARRGADDFGKAIKAAVEAS